MTNEHSKHMINCGKKWYEKHEEVRGNIPNQQSHS